MVKPGLTHHFLQEIHVQSQEYDNCFQIVPLVDMVKLLLIEHMIHYNKQND
jgi:hypothetical protein